MERYKLKTLLMTDEDVRVLMESLERSAHSKEVPDEDRARAYQLRERIGERFDAD